MKISPLSSDNTTNTIATIKLKSQSRASSDNLIKGTMESKVDMTQMMSSNNNSNTNSIGAIDFQAVFSNNNTQFMPKCPLCEKTFANSSNLKHHMNTIHFNEAKWICNECGKVCTSKSNLKVHLRVHLRVKPYYCRWCDYNCMHHSSIRDHLSKCHPDKSHNSCEPGYIFNSTAVPEPELSHFEPNTSNVHSSTLDMDDCKLSQKKLANKMMSQIGNNNNSINTNNKRIKEDMSDSMNDLNSSNQQQFSQEDLTNNIKKFKQDYELNKLKNKKKMGGNHIKVNNKYRGASFKDGTLSFSNNQQISYDAQNNMNNNNLDDSFQQTNEMYDQTYYSDDEHNTSIDETLNDNHHQNIHCNKNSSPSASISSSLTSDSHLSSNSIKNPNLQSLQFLASSMNANNNSNQEQMFANLLSNLPNSQDTGPLNNIAAAVLQRLSTVALLQQFSNNSNNNSQNNGDFSRKSNDDVDGAQLDESGTKSLEANQIKPKLHNALDLSIKAPRKNNNKSCDNDTSDEYYSALSPVSTSSTNLSTSSLSSIAKAKGTNINNKSPSSSTEGNSRKGILDVINRLKSQKVSSQISSNDNAEEMLLKSDSKSTCLEHDLSNNGLDELNDLIKSHLLPISEAVFDKYKSKGNGYQTNGDDCDDYELSDDNFHEAPMEIKKEGLESTLPTLKKNCTFCNIFKNLIDLHELLHKT